MLDRTGPDSYHVHGPHTPQIDVVLRLALLRLDCFLVDRHPVNRKTVDPSFLIRSTGELAAL